MKGPVKSPPDRTISQVKRQFSYRKPICPFISSTFVDFQAEREILVKKVFPNLDALCRERGTYCAPIDLRWGINDSQTKSGQIVQLCLDSISRCAPFFICMLGDRYGSHRPMDAPPLPDSYQDLPPDGDWLDRNLLVAASAGYSWVLQDTFQHASVTELEIMQAAMLTDSEFAFFYFRQPDHVEHLHTDLPEDERKAKLALYESESEYSAWKLGDLKARIVKRGLPIRYFKTPEDLAHIVLDDWRRVVNRLYPPLEDMLADIYTERFTEWMANETFAETRRRAFVKSSALTTLFNQLTDFATEATLTLPTVDEEPESNSAAIYALRTRLKPRRSATIERKSIMNLVGERGCGKTSVVANWVKEFAEERPGIQIFTHFVGSSALSLDVGAMMRRCAQELRGGFHNISQNCTDMCSKEMLEVRRVIESFRAAISLGPCVLIIDGVDELGASNGRSAQKVKEMRWLPKPLPPQCKIILTTVRSDAVHKVLAERSDVNTLAVPLLQDKSTRCEIIREHLAMHCKALNNTQLNRIVNCRLSDRPLFLTILANELRMFGVYSRLDYHLDSYLEAGSIRELWGRIIQRWVKEYGWVNEVSDTGSTAAPTEMDGWVADALRLISVSRHGLSQTEILDVLKLLDYRNETEVTSFDWALFRSSAMDALFEKPGGLFGFFHQHFKEAVEYTLLGAVTPDYPAENGREPPPSPTPLTILDALAVHGPDRKTFHEYLADYFLTSVPHCPRRTDELPWHLLMSGDLDKLCDVVSEPRLFHELMADKQGGMRRFELLHYWRLLSEAGFDASDIYTHMIDTVLKMAPPESEVKDTTGREDDEDSALSDDGCSSPIGHGLPPDDVVNGNHLKQPAVAGPAPATAGFGRYAKKYWTYFNRCSGRTRVNDSTISDRRKRFEYLQDEEESLGFSELDDGRGIGPSSRASEDGGVQRRLAREFGLQPNPSLELNDDEKSFYREVTASYRLELVDETSPQCWQFDKPFSQIEIASLCKCAGEFLAELSQFDHAERLLRLAHDKLNDHFPLKQMEQELLCHIEEKLAHLYLDQLRNEEAHKWLDRALETIEDIINISLECTQDTKLLETKGRLLDTKGEMITHEKKYGEAEQLLTEAECLMIKAHSFTGKSTVCYHMGLLRMGQSSYTDANEFLRTALEQRELWYGKSHPLVAEVLNDLAGLLSHPHNTKCLDKGEAEIHFRRALDIREACLGPSHILVATTLFDLGKLLKKDASSPARSEALVLLRRSLDVRTTLLGADHNLTRAVRRVLAELESEIRAQERLGRSTTPQRAEGRCYSSLSWHDKDILQFEVRDQAKSAEKIKRKFSQDKGYLAFTNGDSPRRSMTPTTLGRRASCPSNAISVISYLTPSSPQGSPRQSPTLSSAGNQSGVIQRKTTIIAVPMSLSQPSLSPPRGLTDDVIDPNTNGRFSTILKFAKQDNMARREEALRQREVQEGRSGNQSQEAEDANHTEEGKDPSSSAVENIDHENTANEIPEFIEAFDTSPKKLHGKTKGSSTRQAASGGRQRMPLATKRHSAPTTRARSTSDSSPRTVAASGKVVSVLLPRRRATSAGITHQQNCRIPGPHDIDLHNTGSVNGPNSAMSSLLGPAPSPRALPDSVHHKSAWYHVPGRYSTSAVPFPHRRSKARTTIETSSMTMSSLFSRSSPQFYGSPRPQSGRHSHNLIAYQGIAPAYSLQGYTG